MNPSICFRMKTYCKQKSLEECMERGKPKTLASVFPEVKWSKALQPFIHDTQIQKINLFQKNKSVDIHAFADSYIPNRYTHQIEDILQAEMEGFTVRLLWRLKYKMKLSLVLTEHKEDVLAYMAERLPSCTSILEGVQFTIHASENVAKSTTAQNVPITNPDSVEKSHQHPTIQRTEDFYQVTGSLNNIGKSFLEVRGWDKVFERFILERFDLRIRIQWEEGKNHENEIKEMDFPTIPKFNLQGNSPKSPSNHEPNVRENRNEKQKEILEERFIDTKSQFKKPIKPTVPHGKKNAKGEGVLLGKAIYDEEEPIQNISLESGMVVFKGEVFQVESRFLKNEKVLVSFDMTDFESSITVKTFLKNEKFDAIKESLKEGQTLYVQGVAQYDKFSRELSVMAKDISLAKKEMRRDEAKEKRVELHLHTHMSTMDGLTSAKAYIERAAFYGHSAIAITDHGVVQAYPDAMDAAKKYGIKVIYGVECYLLDEEMPCILTKGEMPLSIDTVVFDVETTGLNAARCEIIEIGAVKIRKGKIVERFSSFVRPEEAIPDFITNLTGITDEMVKDAPKIEQAMKAFLTFSEGALWVAHNAQFDLSFIREHAKRCQLDVKNAVLDTLALSRKLLPHLKKHRLNILAKHFDISLQNHHRAVDDSEATGLIYLKLLEMLQERAIFNLQDIDPNLKGAEDSKHKRTTHAVLLVKNQEGLRNLYKIISESHLKYFYKKPRVPKRLLMENREGLLVGSSCKEGELFRSIVEGKTQEEIEKIADFYDYLEIQPLSNANAFIKKQVLLDDSDVKKISKTIVSLGKKLNKRVVATGNVHYLDPKDAKFRAVLLESQKGIDVDDAPYHFRTTDEMLEEFLYLGEEVAKEVVITNTRAIADEISTVVPIPKGTFPPKIDGAEEELRSLCETKAMELYGHPLPQIVRERLDKELTSIIKNGFSVMYIIAQKLVWKSLQDGYLVGSRGSVGSSFAAFVAGITEVNSLPPHYRCEACQYTEFITDGSVYCGFDLEEKACLHCDKALVKDGYDIPFETFLGFDGDKEPDIDLNFSGVYQPVAHKYTEELFGEGHVYRAGTIGTIAEKTAFGYVKGYVQDKGLEVTHSEMTRLVKGCTGVKRTTGQHPGGVMIVPSDKHIYDFCPIQRPADDVESNIITTHFDYHSISGRLLKLDILGHDDPTLLRMLQDLTGIDARSIPLGEKKTMELFRHTESLGVTPKDINSDVGTYAVPEFGTKFVRQMLLDTRPTTFAELIRISGLSHGTDVWLNNAQDLVRKGVASLKEVICTRDDIMLYLMHYGLKPKTAFKIMEDVRKGKGLKEEYVAEMIEHKIPEWYIDSCNKIKYMFPKAHAAAYVMMAFRIAWYKVYHPKAFYVAYYSVRADEFDALMMAQGKQKLVEAIREIELKGNECTQKEKNLLTIMEVVNEMYARGISFLPVDLYESDALDFKLTPEGIRLPFKSLQGLGENAAKNMVYARQSGKFLSVEDFQVRSRVSKTVIEILDRVGALSHLPQNNQLSFL